MAKNRDEPQRLQEALKLNQPFACVYYMKEDLRRVWEQPNKAAARHVLDDWILGGGCGRQSGWRTFPLRGGGRQQ